MIGKIKIDLMYENGQFFDNAEINVLFLLPKLLIIDDMFFVQKNEGSTTYVQTFPNIYKTK